MSTIGRWFSTGFFAVALLTAAPALAQRGPAGPPSQPDDGPGMGMGHGAWMAHPEAMDEVAAKIGVDATTLAKVKDRVYKANKEAIGLRAEMQSAQLELRRLLDEDKPDVEKVMRQVEAVTEAGGKLHKNRIRLLLSVRELLTPEQKAKLNQLLAERRGMGHLGNPRHTMGGPGEAPTPPPRGDK